MGGRLRWKKVPSWWWASLCWQPTRRLLQALEARGRRPTSPSTETCRWPGHWRSRSRPTPPLRLEPGSSSSSTRASSLARSRPSPSTSSRPGLLLAATSWPSPPRTSSPLARLIPLARAESVIWSARARMPKTMTTMTLPSTSGLALQQPSFSSAVLQSASSCTLAPRRTAGSPALQLHRDLRQRLGLLLLLLLPHQRVWRPPPESPCPLRPLSRRRSLRRPRDLPRDRLDRLDLPRDRLDRPQDRLDLPQDRLHRPRDRLD